MTDNIEEARTELNKFAQPAKHDINETTAVRARPTISAGF